MSFLLEWNWQGLLPWFWLALVVLFSVVEALTMTLMTVWFAAAALVMVFASMLPIPLVGQLVLFALLSALLLVFSRPLALKFLKLKKTATNSDSLVGRKCKILRPVTPDEKGTARLNGVEWSVASVDGSPLEAGKDCVVHEIKGNTLIVSGEVT
ncbi:MAG: NfeD family protein [Treponema sp.]|nr:NfeD family protein [Treponema sp.]